MGQLLPPAELMPPYGSGQGSAGSGKKRGKDFSGLMPSKIANGAFSDKKAGALTSRRSPEAYGHVLSLKFWKVTMFLHMATKRPFKEVGVGNINGCSP